MSLISPLLLKRLFDEAIPAGNVALIVPLLVGIVVFPVITMALGAVQNYLRASIGEAVSQSLRQALFNHMLYVRMRNLEQIASGRIIRTITKVCGEVGEVYVTNELLPIFTNAALLLGTLGVMFYLNIRLLLVSLIVFPLSWGLVHWMRNYAEGLDREFIKHREHGMNYLLDVVPGMRALRAGTGERYEIGRWVDWLRADWRIKAKTITFHNLTRVLPMDLIGNVGVGLVYGYGAYEVINGRLSVGGLVAFIIYVPRAYVAFETILDGHISTGQAKAAAERIDSLLSLPCEDTPPAAQDAVRGLPLANGKQGSQPAGPERNLREAQPVGQAPQEPTAQSSQVLQASVRTSTGSARTDADTRVTAKDSAGSARADADIALTAKDPAVSTRTDADTSVTVKDSAGTGGAAIEFSNVCFDYGREGFGLENVSFRVEPGAFVGVVGPSGGGKSTVFDLLLRFYEPRSGGIRVDGTNIASLPLPHLRGMIGLVPQDVFLWNDDIYANLVYPSREVTRELVVEAAKAAQLHDFVESLPQGYDTPVGERGLALSGGERQRLALCRAILEEPSILLLDEATSALDALTDQKVRAALETARRGRTTIVVAHRLVTVMNADNILVLDEGRLVQEGAPQELLAQPGLFQDLYEAQKL